MSKPKRDTNVTDLEPIDKTPPAPAAQAPAPEESDIPMPTVENEPDMLFRPQAGCGILDVYEVCLLTLLVMTNNNIEFVPGTLRNMQIPASKVTLLSDRARRHMQPAQVPAAVPAQPEPSES